MNGLAWFATVSTIAFFITNGTQTIEFWRKRSVGASSVVPFAATFVNCMLWLKYGVFMGDAAIISVNALGALVLLYSMIAYWFNAEDRPDTERRTLAVLIPLATIYVLSRLGLIPPQAVGSVAAVASVLMFASPLVTLGTIISRRDSSVLSLPSMGFGLTLAVAWAAYGVTLKDMNVTVPNVLGATLNVVQLVVWAVYRKSGTPSFRVITDKLRGRTSPEPVAQAPTESIKDYDESDDV